jgi:hypothetical protein
MRRAQLNDDGFLRESARGNGGTDDLHRLFERPREVIAQRNRIDELAGDLGVCETRTTLDFRGYRVLMCARVVATGGGEFLEPALRVRSARVDRAGTPLQVLTQVAPLLRRRNGTALTCAEQGTAGAAPSAHAMPADRVHQRSTAQERCRRDRVSPARRAMHPASPPRRPCGWRAAIAAVPRSTAGRSLRRPREVDGVASTSLSRSIDQKCAIRVRP